MGLRYLINEVLTDDENIRLIDSSPLLFVHVCCIGLFFVGFSWVAVAACAATYLIRVFFLTAGYHRYFSHRTFKTSRAFQFIMAFVGCSAAQLGPVWWASHHRHHHKYSDTEKDIHSAFQKGWFWSHMGWLLCRKYLHADYSHVKDLTKYPEIRFIDRYHIIAPITLALSLYALGAWLESAYPVLGTSGWQMVMWGFFLSTVLVYHVTFAINSLTHIFGNKRFNTGDQSKNNIWLAILTMGEGWHNNHHRYPMATRQGMYWWEIDVTYYILKVLSWFRIVWDIQKHPDKLYEEAERLKASGLAPQS